MLAQGSSSREPWDHHSKSLPTLKGFAKRAEPSQGSTPFYSVTQGSRKLEPWANISQRLRRIVEAPQSN